MIYKPMGKLVKTEWLPVTNVAICYTCQYHDSEARIQASYFRARTYENVIEKCYFCDAHLVDAKRAEIVREVSA